MAKSLIAIKVPFRAIDNMIFQKALYMLRPGLTIPHTHTLSRLVNAYVDEFEVSLQRKLPKDGMLSVALDCWTSPFQQSFLAIRSYFIDVSWCLHEVVLGFEPHYGTHLSENIGK